MYARNGGQRHGIENKKGKISRMVKEYMTRDNNKK